MNISDDEGHTTTSACTRTKNMDATIARRKNICAHSFVLPKQGAGGRQFGCEVTLQISSQRQRDGVNQSSLTTPADRDGQRRKKPGATSMDRLGFARRAHLCFRACKQPNLNVCRQLRRIKRERPSWRLLQRDLCNPARPSRHSGATASARNLSSAVICLPRRYGVMQVAWRGRPKPNFNPPK